jgi:hypothetical protein
MSRVLLLSTILILAGPGPAFSQNDDFDHSGFYVGVGFGGAAYAKVEDDLEDSLEAIGYAFSVDSQVPPGLDARAGYQFHPRIAAEVQLQWFAKALIKIEDTHALDLETLVFTGNAKGYLLTGRIQPFLLVGGGLMHYEVTDDLGLGLKVEGNAFAARFGGGVDIYLHRNFVFPLDASYVLPTGDADGLDQVSFSFGFQYRF